MLGFLVIMRMKAKFSGLVLCYIKSLLRSWSCHYLGKYLRYMSSLMLVMMLLCLIQSIYTSIWNVKD